MEESGGTITVSTRDDGEYITISIADTGPGITPENLEMICKPFFTTKGKKGNGMGLYSCKRIIEQEHGGKLEVESVVGTGTVFYLRLQKNMEDASASD